MTSDPRPRQWPRHALVFVVAFVGLCVLAGERLTKPSRDNHFVHLAQGWTEGRMALEGKPPGWCAPRDQARKRCRGHAFDDYAVLYTLTLADGSTVRGYPCRTKACQSAERQGEQTYWVVGQGWRNFERGQVRRGDDTWYITFPPGPAVMMLPFVMVFGPATWDVLLTCLAAALIALVLVRMLDRERGTEDGRGREHLWIAAAWTFGSPACFLGANGRVWFTAQIFGALCLMLYLDAAWRARRPGWAGLWLGLAVACRPINMLPAIVVMGLELWRLRTTGERRALVNAALRFLVPLGAIGLALACYNMARFESPLEFGHRFLEIRWQARMQELGMFSLEYLPRNLRCLLWLAPQVSAEVPYVRVSIHGMALWLSSPWVLAVAAARERFPQRLGLGLAILGAALPSLLYQNSGQLQPVYRFGADWLLLLLLLLAFGGAARRRWFPALVLVAVLVNVAAAWQFARKPGWLFVVDPMGWPFQEELEPG
ncbi:hypothetical protein [Paraliomyxa miuraensis]|uniref:hypothetical protein n=1 Tax=Paraliomyxa miuraensis TaxID=376150 RepID=UPI0022583AB5|nr:hypothetical protein [Paraliomyxa miuraensis]MCX4245024.1 hypothetical protein [Paraliomyxa miuraensis]